MFEIITLAELLRRLSNYNHKELHVHHTWRPSHADYYGTKAINEDARALNRQKAFYDYHVKTNGWNDIAQHVTLLPDGRFVTGRDFGSTPASIAGYNTGAFMVEMIGDFDKGRDKFEGAQKASMIGLAKDFDRRGKYIRFHRENSSKTCPGTGIDKVQFMAEVKGAPAISNGGDDVFKRGDRGDAVKSLQQSLQRLGFDPGTPDGIFGAKTETALILFQRGAGITATGVADSVTVGAILKRLMGIPAADPKIIAENGALKQEVTRLNGFVAAVDAARKKL